MVIDMYTRVVGKKQSVGKITFCKESNRVMVCAGYCPESGHKVLMTLDEAREFAKRYHQRRFTNNRALRAIRRLAD